MSKVGVPGIELGLHTGIRRSQSCSSLSVRTGQFGKNHLGDVNEYLPTTTASTSSTATSTT